MMRSAGSPGNVAIGLAGPDRVRARRSGTVVRAATDDGRRNSLDEVVESLGLDRGGHGARPNTVPIDIRTSLASEPKTPCRYHSDTVLLVAMTLRLSDAEQSALRERAAAEGISMQEAARRAVRDYLTRQAHQERVEAAAMIITEAHAEALERLGQ